ncbi:hypothetical protein EDD85DRAFT_959303 [Armillaria nabsnona]|nr:hypothetical protein EDD85DRAFT_959303 [Armillaria nabsnona]
MSKKAIEAFAGVLQDYATGRLDYHFLSRHDGKGPHANVHHPDAERVHLLLAGLGDPNETLTSWEDIFHSTEEEPRDAFATYSLFLLSFPLILIIPRTVINIPGYGKTRLLFEAVAQYFLIYFTCSKEKATWTSGSGDVQWVVETVNPTPKNMYGGEATQRAIYVLIYARMYVLIYFLDLALSYRLAPLDARRRLLLLQACPPCLASSDDLFVHIAKVVQSFDDETLRRAAGQSLDKFRHSIKEVLHDTTDSPRIHFTFDELHNATRDPWLSNRYSIFPRMLQMVGFSLRPRAIVCAASEISVNMLNIGTLPPVSGVLSYASNTRRLQSDNLEEVLERIKTWLFPRPRLVARLIEMYLTAAQNGVKRIPYHRILSSVLKYRPGIGLWILWTWKRRRRRYPSLFLVNPLVVVSWNMKASTVNTLDHISSSTFAESHNIDPTFMRTISRLLYRWMLSNSSTLTLEWNESPKLLELGVTPLPPFKPRSPSYFMWNVCDDVALTEAYGASSLMALLGSSDINVFKLCMTKAIIVNAEQPELEQTQKDIFERSIVWTLMNNLGKENGCVLEDIFDCYDHAPLWTKQPYRLISFTRGNNVPVRVTWKSGASPRLGFRAREPDDIGQWLRDPKGVPFIFKDDRHSLAFVENRMTLERSVLVVHGALEGNCEMEKQIKDLMKGLQHECAVYSGINDLKGIGKGQIGLFVLS